MALCWNWPDWLSVRVDPSCLGGCVEANRNISWRGKNDFNEIPGNSWNKHKTTCTKSFYGWEWTLKAPQNPWWMHKTGVLLAPPRAHSHTWTSCLTPPPPNQVLSRMSPETWGESWSAQLGAPKVWKWSHPHPPDLIHVENLQSILSKRPAKVGGAVHTQTATLGGSSDVLQRSSSKNLPKTDKISGCESCEAAVKCDVKTGVTCSDGLGWHFFDWV